MINNINKTQHLLDGEAYGQFGYDSPHVLSGNVYYMISELFIHFPDHDLFILQFYTKRGWSVNYISILIEYFMDPSSALFERGYVRSLLYY